MTTAIASPELSLNILPEVWTPATWDSFLAISENPDYEKAKFYYYQGSYYVEIGVGSAHASAHSVISFLAYLYCTIQKIPVYGFTNCSYRKQEVQECQPDISYYVGDKLPFPLGSSVVNLDLVPPPDLVIEIADSSISSDLGIKRLLYEEMGVSEYWVVDVQSLKITAFRILGNLGSDRLTTSQVITGLPLALLEQALERSRDRNNAQVGTLFMEQVKL
jgi:Uma2 family endonuclease